MLIAGKNYTDRTYIMGILNVTPDSFSDGGKYTRLDAAVRRAVQMAAEGADVIDVGGESTRPGFSPVSAAEETERTAPVIERIRREVDIPISIDTSKSEVADAALSAGAALVNDVWGFRSDPDIARVTKKYGASCCLMHNRASAEYGDFIDDVLSDLSASVDIALGAGIPADMIMTDPGIGFAKTYEQNLIMIKHMAELKKLGYPFLLGVSRKSVIGMTLGLPADERVEGTAAASVLAALSGALFVRVHDVKENKRAVAMTQAIMECEANG